MRTYYQGPTYIVTFDEDDTSCFTRYTDAQGVRGRGAFVFDTLSGDLVETKGDARGHEDMEWLAFSQDAQEEARKQLRDAGVAVNPYDFGCDLPEIHNPGNAGRHKTGRIIQIPNPARQGRIINVGDDETIYVEWEDGQNGSLSKSEDHTMPKVWNPPPRITRTRGVKTMRGPYSAARGYKPWIQRRGKLGEGFLTVMSKSERHKALDKCTKAYGYRSCLGSIMALERARTGPRGSGQGVGVKYAAKLRESREYLRQKYGGKGSFGPQQKAPAKRAADAGPGYEANPSRTQHEQRAHSYLKEGEEAIRLGVAHFNNAMRSAPWGRSIQEVRERDQACAYAKDAHRYAILAEHEIDDAKTPKSRATAFMEAVQQLRSAASALLDRLQCSWQAA